MIICSTLAIKPDLGPSKYPGQMGHFSLARSCGSPGQMKEARYHMEGTLENSNIDEFGENSCNHQFLNYISMFSHIHI